MGCRTPTCPGRLVLCARKSSRVAWDGTLESLRPYRLGVVMGYVNTPAIDGADFLQKDTTTSDLLNLKKLLGGRLDAIVIDQFQAIYLLKNNPMLIQGLADVEFLQPPLEQKGIHVLFSRAENRLAGPAGPVQPRSRRHRTGRRKAMHS